MTEGDGVLNLIEWLFLSYPLESLTAGSFVALVVILELVAAKERKHY